MGRCCPAWEGEPGAKGDSKEVGLCPHQRAHEDAVPQLLSEVSRAGPVPEADSAMLWRWPGMSKHRAGEVLSRGRGTLTKQGDPSYCYVVSPSCLLSWLLNEA